jgi:hypothetical protein
VRWLRTVRGEVRYRLLCAPRFDYAAAGHAVEFDRAGTTAAFLPEGDDLPRLRLSGRFPLRRKGADVAAEFTLKAGETASIVLEVEDGRTGAGHPGAGRGPVPRHRPLLARLDRALRLADHRSLPAPLARWYATRDAIHADIHENFWDEGQRAFVQAKGGKAVDAATLLMPLVRFIGPTDPRWLSTLDAIGAKLADDALVRRYDLETARRRAGGRGGQLHHLLVLVHRVLGQGRPRRGGPAPVREDAGLRQPPGPLRRGAGPSGEHLGHYPQALTHSAILYGLRISLVVSVASTALAFAIGVTLGVAAGYFGGRLDAFLMRVVDIQLSFPRS